MERDMDLVRRILHEVEKAPFDMGGVDVKLPGVSDEALQNHLLLLWEADLIHAMDASGGGNPQYLPIRLTWIGHEFLDASRDDTLWNKAKGVVVKKTGGLTFEVLFALLKEWAKEAVLGGGSA